MWYSILVLIIYAVLYGLLHSVMAASAVKRWGHRRFGELFERGYRLFFNFVALITLLPLPFLLADLPDHLLYVVPAPWHGAMLAGQGVAFICLVVTLFQTKLLYFAGLTQLVAADAERSDTLVVRGFYGYVRHPLYLFSILLIWLTPTVTVNLFTAYLVFTLYFYLGSIHEEQRLLREFGMAYRQYRQQVPQFLPWPGRRWQPQI